MFEDVLLVIEGCLREEEWAWRIFVKEFGSMAENILRKFSDFAPQDRENIIQNVFIKLLKGGLSNFKGSAKYEFFKYFKTIAIHEGISYLKSEGKDKGNISLNGEDSEGFSLKDFIPSQDPLLRPDLTVEGKETLDIIQKVMEGFPLLDQQIFWMKLQGYKDEEIKKILGIPLGTVASKYSRIKTKIIEVLGEGYI
jgi:RNA polymerase sigma factor (sigma-70 family)